MVWKAKAKPTPAEVQHAHSLLPPNALWKIGLIEESGHIQFRGAMHPNYNGPGEHPGVEVWTDILEDQYGYKANPMVGYSTTPADEVDVVLAAIEAHGYPRDEAYSAVRIESGWKPNALNKLTNAVGLIQLMPFNLKNVKFDGTWQDFQKLSAAEQAPYISNYFGLPGIHGAWKYPGDTYVALAAGGYVGKPPDTIVYKQGSKAVEQNKIWDIDKSGDITVAELRQILLSRMKTAPPGGTASPTPKAPDSDSQSREEWLSLLAQSLLEDAGDRKYAKLPPKTDAVLRRYQLVNKLVVDGIPGKNTLGKLFT